MSGCGWGDGVELGFGHGGGGHCVGSRGLVTAAAGGHLMSTLRTATAKEVGGTWDVSDVLTLEP